MESGVRFFSTTRLPPGRTLDAWRDYMAEVYYRVDVKPSRGDLVRGELKEVLLGGIGLSSFKADQQRVLRYASAAAADNSDNFVLIFPLRRKLYFDQRGRDGFIDPGSVVMLRSSEYYEASCPDAFENVTIKVPAGMLAARIAGADDLCAREGVANPTLVGVVTDMATRLLRERAEWTVEHAARLAGVMSDLVALMLEGPAGANPLSTQDRSLMAHQLEQVCGHIREHLGEEDLTPASVAAAQGISVRYLHKLFERRGTTFGRWLLEARLEEARRRILADGSCTASLQDIALACGFVSQAHFSTRYRAHFGESPRETRARIRG